MQLIAGRTGQEYNQRKTRQGAFWEDRYHATAIETDAHLQHCIIYIDLNMVRAGVVNHPLKWVYSGFYEVQQSPKRYRLIDLPTLLALCGFSKQVDFQQARRQWVEQALQGALAMRGGRKHLRLAVKLSSRR
jgi:putative transposase